MYELFSIVLSLIAEVQVNPENIITGAIAIITVFLGLICFGFYSF